MMKQTFKVAGFLALTGLIASCKSEQKLADYQVIPLPQEIAVLQNNPFVLGGDVKIIYPEGNEKMHKNALFLAEYLKKATGKDFAIQTGTEGKNAIVLQLGI